VLGPFDAWRQENQGGDKRRRPALNPGGAALYQKAERFPPKGREWQGERGNSMAMQKQALNRKCQERQTKKAR